uniref:GDNF-inducible zinc finger protein 1-like n=1 Tax=Steinernema glaseri TaxID=37863 RepID=A0A1I7YDY9_9BILA
MRSSVVANLAVAESLWCTLCDSLFCSCLDEFLDTSTSSTADEDPASNEQPWTITGQEIAEGMAETRTWREMCNTEEGAQNDNRSQNKDEELDMEDVIKVIYVDEKPVKKARSDEEGERKLYERFREKQYDEELDMEDVIKVIYVDEKPVKKARSDEEGERKLYERFREKQYVCDLCEQSFTLKQNVQQHIFNFHGLRSTSPDRNHIDRRFKRFLCEKCDKIFKTKEMAENHFKKVHKKPVHNEKKILQCNYCQKVYPTNTQLKEHISIVHFNERKFVCDQCGSAFGRRGGLRRHIQMVHIGTLYDCPYEDCDHPGYKCPKALAAHVRAVHTGDRPFLCSQCDRSFVRRNDLKVHEVTHSAMVDQKCDLCGSVFKRAHYLKKHLRNCDGRRKYVSAVSSCVRPKRKAAIASRRYTAALSQKSVIQVSSTEKRRTLPNRKAKNRVC